MDLTVPVANDSCHAQTSVIQNMAMKEPIVKLIAFKLNHPSGHRWYIDRMFQWRVIALSVEHTQEVAVKVHGMMHHGFVDHYVDARYQEIE